MIEGLENYKQSEFPSYLPKEKFESFFAEERSLAQKMRYVECLQIKQKFVSEKFEDKDGLLSAYDKNEAELLLINTNILLAKRKADLFQTLLSREKTIEMFVICHKEVPEHFEANLKNARLRAVKDVQLRNWLNEEYKEELFEESYYYKYSFYLTLKKALYPSQENGMTVSKGGQQN
jgi:hypothetical protein